MFRRIFFFLLFVRGGVGFYGLCFIIFSAKKMGRERSCVMGSILLLTCTECIMDDKGKWNM